MTAGSPYSPPKSVVQDAVVPSKLERRLLRDLVRMFDEEPARLALIRKVAWTLLVFGAVATAWGVWSVAATSSPTLWMTVLAIVGAYVAGMSNFFFTSLRQWPVVRRYLDAERIRADYEALTR